MSWAGVPVITVDEHRNAPAGKDEVGYTPGGEAALEAEPCADGVECLTEQQLRLSVGLPSFAQVPSLAGTDPARHPEPGCSWAATLNRSGPSEGSSSRSPTMALMTRVAS